MGNTASGASSYNAPLQTSRVASTGTRDGLRVITVGPAGDPRATRLSVCVMSDTHARHRSLLLPASGADVLVHAGDHANWKTSARNTRDFNAWLGEIAGRFPVRLVCCGNHEISMDKAGSRAERAAMVPNARYCEGETVVVGGGISIFFAPWTPSRNFTFRANAFQRSPDQLAELLLPCPDNVDVLVTHCPPLGVLDMHRNGHRMGSREVLDCVHRVLPSVHLFGHCHDDSGVVTAQIDTRQTIAARWRHKVRKDRGMKLKADANGKAGVGTSNNGEVEKAGVGGVVAATAAAAWMCSHCSFANNPPLFLACQVCNIEKTRMDAPKVGIVRRSSLRARLSGVGVSLLASSIGDEKGDQLPLQQKQDQKPADLQTNVLFVNASNRQGEQPLLLDIYYYLPSYGAEEVTQHASSAGRFRAETDCAVEV